jgi:hypothetical protein
MNPQPSAFHVSKEQWDFLVETQRKTFKMASETHMAVCGDTQLGIRGVVGGLKETNNHIATIDSRVSKLEGWRNIIVGGSAVAWIVFTAFCWIAYDWLRENLATISEMVKHANKN